MSNKEFFKQQLYEYKNRKYERLTNMNSCPDCECYGCYKHGECGTCCDNKFKQNHKLKPHRDHGFESWYRSAMKLYRQMAIKNPTFVREWNTLDLIRRGFEDNIDKYPKWKDTLSLVNFELGLIKELLEGE